jgi:hypothetical protein
MFNNKYQKILKELSISRKLKEYYRFNYIISDNNLEKSIVLKDLDKHDKKYVN